eukprot:scaffold196806_cov21-Tisochrysis_lutea.AAC.1
MWPSVTPCGLIHVPLPRQAPQEFPGPAQGSAHLWPGGGHFGAQLPEGAISGRHPGAAILQMAWNA